MFIIINIEYIIPFLTFNKYGYNVYFMFNFMSHSIKKGCLEINIMNTEIIKYNVELLGQCL